MQRINQEDCHNDEKDVDDANYKFIANVNKKLSKILGIQDITFDERLLDCTPPKESGLNNCDYIIPKYYHLSETPDKMYKIDYFEIIKDEVRNLRTLNKYQLEFIKTLSSECKNEIIESFNNCIDTVNKIL